MTHTARTVRTLQAVAMTVGLALFLWSTGLPTFFRFAEAASITNASDTLSNSAPSVTSNHTIAFELPNGMATSSNFTVTFASQFDTSGVLIGDIDLSVNTVDQTLAGASGAGTWGVTGIGTDAITFETPTDGGTASSSDMIIKIGSNATGGAIKIVNPSATTSYPITIAGTMQDSGEMRVAIVDQVTVSANVDTSLTFTVTGVNSSSTVNGSPTTTIATSTPTTLPFGNLPIGVSRTLAHDLSVSTNASVGYTVTVQQAGSLQSTTGATIDGFIDGTNTVTPSAWQGPGGLIANPNSYGHWGLTSNDTAILARSVQFGSNEWVSGSTTPIAIMGHNGPSDGTTINSGAARVGYQIQISALQEAGDDYTTTLRYVATPTF
ncbi:hypothetical protein IPH92_01615 [Candidatus Kaiserbacteria bacterium]|nr:MAG: hypothetical protein IPH92_01615 [Candidatus Kaiserbacteria bacterium]